jgi:hypothetical protein
MTAHRNFDPNDTAVVRRTGCELDGMIVRIIGIIFNPTSSDSANYICWHIKGTPAGYKWPAFSISEAYLDPCTIPALLPDV